MNNINSLLFAVAIVAVTFCAIATIYIFGVSYSLYAYRERFALGSDSLLCQSESTVQQIHGKPNTILRYRNCENGQIGRILRYEIQTGDYETTFDYILTPISDTDNQYVIRIQALRYRATDIKRYRSIINQKFDTSICIIDSPTMGNI